MIAVKAVYHEAMEQINARFIFLREQQDFLLRHHSIKLRHTMCHALAQQKRGVQANLRTDICRKKCTLRPQGNVTSMQLTNSQVTACFECL